MGQVNEAYRILSDSKKRKDYDDGKPEEVEENKARGLVMKVFSDVYPKFIEDPKKNNILKMVRELLMDQVTRAIEGIEASNKMIENTEESLKRLEDSPLLEGALQTTINQLNNEKIRWDEDKEEAEEALGLIEDGKYKIDREASLSDFGAQDSQVRGGVFGKRYF